jgi:hypothetical protein
LIEGDVTYEMHRGDSLRRGPPSDSQYVNRGKRACRYLLVLSHTGRG